MRHYAEGSRVTCPVNPEHGRVYDLAFDRWYCPHQEHDREHTRAIFSEEEVFAGHVKPSVAVAAPRKRGKRK